VRTRSYIFTTISCLIVIMAPVVTLTPADNLTATSGVRRLLKGGEVIGGDVTALVTDKSVRGMYYVGDSTWVGGGIWFSLSMSIFTMMPYCAITAFGRRLSLFSLSLCA
jgi:hypothetical protein